MTNKTFIGVVGTNGSGKTTLCNYLVSKGFFLVSLSDIIRQLMGAEAIEANRETLTSFSNKLKQEKGLDYCAIQAYQEILSLKKDLAVFDSIRHPKEVMFLKRKQVLMIGLDTSLEARFDRIKARKRNTDFVDYTTFKHQDQNESSGLSYGQSINECLKLCDHKLVNNTTLKDFYSKIDQFLYKLKNK